MMANNGDQFFSATFSRSQDIHEYQAAFPPPATRQSPITMGDQQQGPNGPVGPHRMMVNSFGNMSLQGRPQHPLSKGRNPGASEFVPRPAASEFVPRQGGLAHSASSPSFSNLAGNLSGNLPNNLSGMSSLGTRTPVSVQGLSPGASPRMSPQGSPLMMRRNKSPMQPLQTQPNQTSTPTPPNAPPIQLENIGGTTYFFTEGDSNASSQQNSSMNLNASGIVQVPYNMYPGALPHVAHMKLKSNIPSFSMPDEIKMDILNKHTLILQTMDAEVSADIPQQVDTYHDLVPLEAPPMNPMQKSTTFGYPTTCYKATNMKNGLVYCLRRIHGFRLVNTKCMELIDLWKKIQHSNIVQLREVFTTKAFGDHSMVFVFDYHPAGETLMMRHFNNPQPHLNGYSSPYNIGGAARPFSAGKGGVNRQNAGLLPESAIWSYVVQLSSALRTIHAHGLACRVMDPTKILLTGKTRLRLNCVGIFDVLSFDATQANPLALMPHCQQEDLVSLGKVVLALACNSVIGIQREHIQTSINLVARNYSVDLKNLILYLLSNQNRNKNVNDIMPMIGARFYTQLDAAQLRNDVLENEVAKQVESDRLFRLVCKMGVMNERPEYNMDPGWSETGDRYMLKLFRDFLFHQVDENGAPWIDMAHIIQCMNKLDSGSPEKLTLMSRDEQSVIVVSYAELKRCFEMSFSELISPGHTNNFS
ncbi:unnamed protein product [Owenia fusiformis]|uniref:PAN2-PAN3 deadenylation complex subunit PAN3 n=1 Tax=Owenia fusiformis TaxID=6347 RepID=A0A8J1XKJ0_OWEFU|nr:unnamed protein product [Owenia fusiformis]